MVPEKTKEVGRAVAQFRLQDGSKGVKATLFPWRATDLRTDAPIAGRTTTWHAIKRAGTWTKKRLDLVGTNPMDNLAVRHSAVNGTFFHLLARWGGQKCRGIRKFYDTSPSCNHSQPKEDPALSSLSRLPPSHIKITIAFRSVPYAAVRCTFALIWSIAFARVIRRNAMGTSWGIANQNWSQVAILDMPLAHF